MVRRRYQRGSLFKRGKREKVWVVRWWEDFINTDGTIARVRRSIVTGTVAQLATRRLAMQASSIEQLEQALFGHASPEITRQIYLHAIRAEQRRAVEEVEKLLVGPKWTQI